MMGKRAAAIFTFEEMGDMLDEAAASLPDEIFKHLNGGVSLLPDTKRSKADLDGSLYTLGEYRHDAMGRYILIYAGSVLAAYPDNTAHEMRELLQHVLRHELTHHLESLAGERDLELEDKRQLYEYRRDVENGI